MIAKISDATRQRLGDRLVVASISGGKDSAALARQGGSRRLRYEHDPGIAGHDRGGSASWPTSGGGRQERKQTNAGSTPASPKGATMAEGIDYEEKYSETQKKMREWQQKYHESLIHEKRHARTAMLVAVATGIAGAAVGYVAGVLRVGR